MDSLFKSDREILHELGRKFKLARVNRRMSQDDLATHSGISRTTISRLEKGQGISTVNYISLLRAVGQLERFLSVMNDVVPDPRLTPVSKKVRYKRNEQ